MCISFTKLQNLYKSPKYLVMYIFYKKVCKLNLQEIILKNVLQNFNFQISTEFKIELKLNSNSKSKIKIIL